MKSTRPGGRTARIGLAVMDATLDELAEVGFADFSVERVAERSGANKTTIYRRWGGRDDLIVAAIETGDRQVTPLPDTGSLRSDLIAAGMAYIAYFANARANAITRVMSAATEPRLVEARRALYRSREAAMRAVYARAVRRGELRSTAGVDIAVETMFGAVQHHAFVMGRPLTRRFVERVTDHTLSALGAVDAAAPQYAP